MSDTILQVKNLSKTYPEFSLKKVNLELPRGYVMGLIGQNGAGKSTTIKAILNLIHPDEGEIRLLGRDSVHDAMEIKNRIGFVGENQYFYEEMSVKWTVNFFKQIYRTWNDALCRDLLTKFKISQSKKVKDLSKGMRVKLAFTLAFAHEPELLILDEPTSGLDPAARHDVLQEILEMIKDEQKSVFFSSHITQDLEKIADFVTFIDDGKVIFSEEKDMVLDRFKKVTFHLTDERVLSELKPAFVSLKHVGRTCLGITGSVEQVKQSCHKMAGNLEILPVGLDEIFLAYVKGEVS